MSTVGGGVNIVRDGLVMYLDASNTKSLADVPSRNLITWSEDFTNGTWNTSNISVTANQSVSPSGLQDADLVDDGVVTNTQHWLYQNPTFLYNTTYTLSVFTKYISRKYMTINIYNGVTSQYVDYDILNGVVYGTTGDVTATIQSYGNSWYRLSYTRTMAATGTPNFRIAMADDFGSETYTGSNKQVYLYGAQLEVGPVATTYIPTTTVPVSRIPTWVDVSRGGNNGILSSGLTYDYSNGGGLTFDGINNNFTFPTITFTNTPYTIELVCNITGPIDGSNRRNIFGGNISYTSEFSNLTTYLTNITCDSTPTYFNFVFSTAGSIVQNTIFHWVFTLDSSKNVRVYFNGKPTTSVDTQLIGYTNLISTFNRFGIWQTTRPFIGNLYTTRIYNKALSASEVLQNYNATKSKFGL